MLAFFISTFGEYLQVYLGPILVPIVQKFIF